MFYIIKGSVELLLPRQKNNILIKELNVFIFFNLPHFIYKQKDETFGEYCFFTTHKHAYSCRAKSFTSIYAIPIKGFLEIIRETPEDYEAYCMIRDSLLFNNEQNFIRTKCFSCNTYTHKISQCPLVHYVPDHEKVIKQYEFYHDQSRKPYFRRAKHRFSFKKINFSANEIQKNMEKEKHKCFYDDFRDTRVNESFSNPESQNLDNLFIDLKLRGGLSNKSLDNDEEGILLKKSNFMNKNRDKSTYHNLDVLEEEEEEEELKLQSEENNEEFQENLIDLRKKESNENKLIENKLTHIRSQDYFPSKKSYENLYKIIEKKENKNENELKYGEEEKNIIFESMYQFQQYFPEMNYKKAIKAFEFQKIRNMLISKTFFIISSPEIPNFELKLKAKLHNFNRYSFRTSKYKEIILRTYENKKLLPKRRNFPNKTILNLGSFPRKKSYFKSPKFQEPKKKTLEELISSLLKQKKISILKNFK